MLGDTAAVHANIGVLSGQDTLAKLGGNDAWMLARLDIASGRACVVATGASVWLPE